MMSRIEFKENQPFPVVDYDHFFYDSTSWAFSPKVQEGQSGEEDIEGTISGIIILIIQGEWEYQFTLIQIQKSFPILLELDS